MFNIYRVTTATAVIALSLVACACTSTASDETAARVGSRDITLKQIDSLIKQQIDAGNLPSGPLGSAELVAARLSVLDNLIREEALFIKAQKESLVPDENKISQEIQRRKQEATLTEEQYQNQIKEAGLTDEDVREKVRKELTISALNDREKARVKAPSEDEIQKYYEDHKPEFVADRGADISVIVTDPANNGASDDAIGAAPAQQKINDIYEKLKTGADFATVASQRSEDPNSGGTRAGRLGFASEQQLKQTFPTRPEIPVRLMAMSAGQYTEPIQDSQSGSWYIIKVNGKREQAQNLTLEDVRRNIIDKITQQRQQILLSALLMVATAETTVKNYLAQRIVEKPESVATMRPSQLLEQQAPAAQPQPRIENENSSQMNVNRPTSTNTNAAGSTNSNRNRNTNK